MYLSYFLEEWIRIGRMYNFKIIKIFYNDVIKLLNRNGMAQSIQMRMPEEIVTTAFFINKIYTT